MPETIQLSAFIKIGDAGHIESLRKQGIIYCNTVSFFREIESKHQERHDNREGAISSIVATNLQIFKPGDDKPLPLNITEAHLNTFDDPQSQGHLFCVFMITPDHATGLPFIDRKNLEFGKKALLINNPTEFVERIRRAIGSNLQYGSVDYYDEKEDQPNLTLFHKPERFKHQSEFRFRIKGQPPDRPFQFKIGSIEDISQILDGELLTKLTLEYGD